MGRFDGKVAIVTGAGRGIGRAEALLLASTSDKPWTIDSVDAVRAQLLARSDGAIPPFFFPSPA